MTDNRERAEALTAAAAIEVNEYVTDAIEAALDEAEKRGGHTTYTLTMDAISRNSASGVASLNAILDKVVEMDRCKCGDGSVEITRPGHAPDCEGDCVNCPVPVLEFVEHEDCSGTGDGPIARMVKEARG